MKISSSAKSFSDKRIPESVCDILTMFSHAEGAISGYDGGSLDMLPSANITAANVHVISASTTTARRDKIYF